MSQIPPQMGHWGAAFVNAKVGDETIPLGPTHWARGLQAVVPFPYRRARGASFMGGGVWQDNFDGSFTQLDDDYYVPATGYSYLDLYLMGLISPSEVPDFFILRRLTPAGPPFLFFAPCRPPAATRATVRCSGPTERESASRTSSRSRVRGSRTSTPPRASSHPEWSCRG